MIFDMVKNKCRDPIIITDEDMENRTYISKVAREWDIQRVFAFGVEWKFLIRR